MDEAAESAATWEPAMPVGEFIKFVQDAIAARPPLADVDLAAVADAAARLRDDPEVRAALDSFRAWCEVDGCPAAICGGPHREVVTTLGTEILKEDQTPLGRLLDSDGKAS